MKTRFSMSSTRRGLGIPMNSSARNIEVNASIGFSINNEFDTSIACGLVTKVILV